LNSRYILVGLVTVVGFVVGMLSISSIDGNDKPLAARSQHTDIESTVLLEDTLVLFGSDGGAPSMGDTEELHEPMPLSADEQQILVDELVGSVFFEKQGREQFVTALREVLSNQYGPKEADFYADLFTSEDWLAAKELIENHAASSGQNYDAWMMQAGLEFGDISADEIEMLVSRGAVLPQNALSKLARKGQVDTIASLVDVGLISDLNAVDPDNGRNALSETIQRISDWSHNYSPAQAANAVERLISLGIKSSNYTGGRDSLDYALDGINTSNAKVKLAMVEALLSQGRALSSAQRELIDNIPNAAAANAK